jgi:bifunctional DNA-binding transcriptional regulator/antitoxin component of YhaV-PrlF toxin-antitoxin module
MEQERKFTIAEFITEVGEDLTIQLPLQLLEVLGINPGQAINFVIDEKGNVSVEAYYPEVKNTKASTAPEPITGEVEQAALFDI